MYRQWRWFWLICMLTSMNTIAQGKFAGTKRDFIGTEYSDSRNISSLKGWIFQQGSMITPVGDPEMITLVVFQKGTIGLIIAGYKEDTALNFFTIADVIEVKNIMEGWQIRTAFCRQNKIDNIEIVALVKSSVTEEFLKPAKKAWQFNRDKRRFENISAKRIDCFNEGLD